MILKHAMDSAVVSSCSWSMVKTLKSMRRDLVKHFQSQAQRWANGRYAMEAVEPATAYHGFFLWCEIHRRSGMGSMVLAMFYHLIITNIAIENHHF